MNKPQGDQTDWSDKSIFSTGEAAQVCKVSQQTIIRCFDSGRLRGFRVPGSKFRRIPRDELIRFMQDNDIPVGRIEGRRRRVLCIVAPGGVLAALGEEIRPEDRTDLLYAESSFDAGWMCNELQPNLVLIGPGVAHGIRAAVAERYAISGTGLPLIVHVGSVSASSQAPDLRLDGSEPMASIARKLVSLLDDSEESDHE